MEAQAIALEIAKKHGIAMAKELVLLAVIPAIEEVVAKSENKIDDVVLAALKSAIVEAVEKL